MTLRLPFGGSRRRAKAAAKAAPEAPKKRRGPSRLEAAAWFTVAVAILAWPGRAQGRGALSATSEPPPPMPWWRRLFSSGLGLPSASEVDVMEAKEPGRGRDAPAPSKIPPPGWKDILWRTWQEFNNDRVPAVAGSVAFFGLLSVFPALAAFVSLYGLFADVQTVLKQLDLLAGLLPRDALQFVGEQMLRIAEGRGDRLGLAFAFSLALSLWSANAGMKALFDGLNVAYEEKEKRGFFRLNAIALCFTVGGIVFVLAVLGLVVALPLALSLLGYSGANPMWMLRWPLLLAVVILALAGLYRYGPSRRQARWRWVTWGSVAAALLWLVASMAFSFYVGRFAHYDRTYGSLGAVVGFMTWIWLSVIVVLLGAELNAEIEHQTAVDSTVGTPKPMGTRHAKMADTLGKTSEKMAVEEPKPQTPPLSGDRLGPKK
jgi:membrane protein